MIKNFNNTTSQVKLVSKIRKSGETNFTETSNQEYTTFQKGDEIQIEINNFEFIAGQDISFATIIVWFESVPANTKLKLESQLRADPIDIFELRSERIESIERTPNINYVSFDITQHIKDCITNNAMYPLKLTLMSNSNLKFIGYGFIDDQNNSQPKNKKLPYIQMNYASIEGQEEHYSYLNQELVYAGLGRVNIRSGGLIFINQLFKTMSPSCSFGLNLFYNSLFPNETSIVGKGWKTIFDYKIDLSTKDTDDIIKLTDYTHKKAYFELLSQEKLHDLSFNSSDIIYYCYAESTYIKDNQDSTFTFVSKNNDKMKFMCEGNKVVIISIINSIGETATLTYDNNKLTKITFSDGNEMTFIYENNKLVKIQVKYEDIYVQFNYLEDKLKDVYVKRDLLDELHPDLDDIKHDIIKHIQFDYTSEHLSCVLSVVDGTGFSYLYDEKFRVTNIQKFVLDSSNQRNTGSTFELTFEKDYTKVEDLEGKSVRYYFDNYGSVLYTIDDKNMTRSYKYGIVNEYDEKRNCHKLLSQSEIQTNLRNLITNHSFEFDKSEILYGWTVVKEKFGSNPTLSKSDDGLYGNSCLKIDTTNGSKCQLKQTIQTPDKGTFNLFGFFKTNTGTVNYLTITLLAKYREKSINIVNGRPAIRYVNKEATFEKSFNGTFNKWQKFEINEINLPSSAEINMTINANGSGILFLDELQFTKDNFKSRYNFVKNSHFENMQDNFPTEWTGYNLTDSDHLMLTMLIEPTKNEIFGDRCFMFSGDDNTEEKEISQTISIKGDAGETLTINGWVKSFVTANEVFKFIVGVRYKNLKGNKIKNYHFNVTKNIDTWQVITNSIITEFPYDQVILTIVHRGFHYAYLDAVQLYKSDVGSTFSYDKKGNLVSVANETITKQNTFDVNNNMKIKSCADGKTFKYDYDAQGRITNIEDNFGNNAAFSYSDDNKELVKEIRSNNNLIIHTSEITDEFGNKTFYDEFGNQETSHYDEKGNIVYTENQDGLAIRKVYDSQSKLIEVERSVERNSLGTCNYEYNKAGKVTKIICANGTVLEFTYDDWGRCIQAKIQDDIIVERDVSDRTMVDKDFINSETINGIVAKEFVYDDNGNPTIIRVDEEDRFKLMYDDLNRLIELQDLEQNINYYFNYDFHGNLISQTDNKGNQIVYDYDNLGNKQKEIINQETGNVAFDFHYDYEMNEYNRDSFFSRLDRTYQDDIIVGNNGCDGLYGARSLRRYYRFTYDEDIKLNTMELGFAKQYLQYDLSSVNSSRQNTLSHGGKFNKYLWSLNFEKSKAVYGWFKVLGIINDKTLITLKGDNLDVKLVMNDANNLSLIANNVTRTFEIEDSMLNNWIMPAVIVFNQEDSTKICLYLNGNYLGMISLTTELCGNLKFLLIGDSQMGDNDEAYSSANATPIRIAFMSIGSYHYKKINIKSIYDQSEHYFINADQTKKRSGVSLTTLNSDDYDFISLNGSFISNKGIKPLNHSYSDGAFKIDKTKTFIFDSELGRHVYGSYKGALQLNDSNDSRLTYDLSFGKKISLSVSFKDVYESNDEDLRTILSITDSDYNETVGVYINGETNKLCTFINGEMRKLGTSPISKNEYHQITLLVAANSFRIYCDNTLLDMGAFAINVEGCLLNLGCSVKKAEGREVVFRHLNGNIKDLLFTSVMSSMQVLSQTSICNKGSFTYDYDSFGRMTKEKTNINNLSYFKEYEYLKPKDLDGNEISNRTTTKVGKTIDSLGVEENIQYDIYGNVTSLKETKDNITKQINYGYDGLFRLVESSSSLGTYKYTYDENGNIQEKILQSDDEIIERQNFIYDENNHDKLVSVITQKTDEQAQTCNIIYSQNSLYPISIGSNELRWQGANLVEIVHEDSSIQFVYNSANKRIKKICEECTINYLYDKERLIAEQGTNYSVTYIYDETNEIKGFVYSKNGLNAIYGFIKNYLGIITGIIDEDGDIICSYSYDDFGSVLTKTGDEEILGINHILYKGYYYDEEISSYMLGQRIYSPKLHRFISPDNFENILNSHSELLQYNLFAYCDNNPIVRSDNSGKSWFDNICFFVRKCVEAAVTVVIAAVGKAIGTVVGVVASIFTAAASIAQSIYEGKSISEAFYDCLETIGKTIFAGEKVGFGAGMYVSGAIFGNSNYKDCFYVAINSAWNDINEIVTDNIIGIMAIADEVHSLIYSPCVSVISMLLNPVVGFITIAIQVVYVAPQLTNLIYNYQMNSQLENQLMVPTTQLETGELIPGKAFNVIIDGVRYISEQGGRDGPLKYKEGTTEVDDSEWTYKYDKYKFGITNVKEAGCEVMAIYNMFKLINKPKKFCDLLYYFERQNLLFGKLGAWPTHIKKLLKSENIDFDVVYNENEVNDLVKNKNNYKCFIPTYWNGRLIGSAHTTCVIPVKQYAAIVSDYHRHYHVFVLDVNGSENFEYKDTENQILSINSNTNLFEVNGENQPCKNFKNIFYDDFKYNNVEASEQRVLPFDYKLISIFAIK